MLNCWKLGTDGGSHHEISFTPPREMSTSNRELRHLIGAGKAAAGDGRGHMLHLLKDCLSCIHSSGGSRTNSG